MGVQLRQKEQLRTQFFEVFVWAGDSPTKPRQGSSSAHPFDQGWNSVLGEPLRLRA
jgi:hypothetical protein